MEFKGNCYIYCEYTKDDRGKTGQGHVYYGTKENSTAGTGSGTDFGMSYYQYYYWLISKLDEKMLTNHLEFSVSAVLTTCLEWKKFNQT